MAGQTKGASPTIVPSLIYQDPAAAIDWLEQAFGFELSMMVKGPDGRPAHVELTLGDALIYVGGDDWADCLGSPTALGGKNTQILNVTVDDANAHHARAKKAGAKILAEPSDQFYGDRAYRALDLEGHYWTFNQKIRTVSIADMEKATGFKIEIRK